MNKHLSKINNDYLRYANCWEDADLLIRALEIEEGDRVLSIGSAGDNSFSLLASSPEKVVAVDINPAQLKLINLKKAAYQALNHLEFLEFLGFATSNNRLDLFMRVRVFLNKEDCKFWLERIEQIENGIIYQGKFENYFKIFRQKVLPFIHSEENVKTLLEEKSQKEQSQFFANSWNSLRWKTAFKLFFSRTLMGWLGRDPKFLAEVEQPVSSFILAQAEKQLKSKSCQSNYFLDFILGGKFSKQLPHYARAENYDSIRNNIDRLEILQGYAGDAFAHYGKFNKFNLSNIFEYMDMKTFKSVADNLIEYGMAQAKYAYWNLMVPRTMASINSMVNTQTIATADDRGFFYSSMHLNQKS
jgi:S-adenosylmethionine-diacylglycerol 3-amino-3-carboxypropyl transferase